jgi:tetratricopeptide (TPR) repeat protein
MLILVLPGTLYPSAYFRSLDLIDLGDHHQDVGEEIEGVKIFLQIYPEQCSPYEYLADLYFENQQSHLSSSTYHQAWDMGCLSTDGMANLIQLEKEDTTQLEKDLSLWIAQYPVTKDEVYQTLLNLYEEQGQSQQAADLAERWIKNMPDHAAAWQAFFAYGPYFPIDLMREKASHIFTLNASLGEDAQRVVDAYLLSTGETDDVLYYRLGVAYSNNGRWAIAEECFHRSLTLEPNRTEGWVYLAIALKNQEKDSDLAIQNAQKYNNDSDMTRSLMGIYWRDSNPEIAYVYWMKLISSQPDVPEWLLEAGSSLAQIGDLEQAQAHYQHAVEIAPDQVEVRAAYVRFCLMYGIDLSTTALEQTRAMIQIEPENIDGYLLEGQILLVTEDYLTAERMFLQALKIDESSTAAHYFLGLLYANMDQEELSRQHLMVASNAEGSSYQRAAARLLDIP